MAYQRSPIAHTSWKLRRRCHHWSKTRPAKMRLTTLEPSGNSTFRALIRGPTIEMSAESASTGVPAESQIPWGGKADGGDASEHEHAREPAAERPVQQARLGVLGVFERTPGDDEAVLPRVDHDGAADRRGRLPGDHVLAMGTHVVEDAGRRQRLNPGERGR